MKKNAGTLDRIIRIILAIFFAVLIFTGIVNGIGAIIIGVFILIFIFTGITGFCPVYTLVGIHTLRTKSGPDD